MGPAVHAQAKAARAAGRRRGASTARWRQAVALWLHAVVEGKGGGKCDEKDCQQGGKHLSSSTPRDRPPPATPWGVRGSQLSVNVFAHPSGRPVRELQGTANLPASRAAHSTAIWKPAFYEIFVKPDGFTPEPFIPDFDRYNRVFDK